jgi:hypothetical protein
VNRYIAVTGITIAGIAILGILAYTNLEIHPVKKTVNASREAWANEFLAMERWLGENGRPVRKIPSGNPLTLEGAPEKTAFVNFLSFNWADDPERIAAWISRGGHLIVTLNTAPYMESAFSLFLAAFGVRAEEYPRDKDGQKPEPADTAAAELEETGEKGQAGTSPASAGPDTIPDFNQTVCFGIVEDTGGMEDPGVTETLKDARENIVLVTVRTGKGRLTVTGRPLFMTNFFISSEKNARFAWNLFAGEGGVLFIQGKSTVKSLFGKFAERGNLPPFFVSLALLVIAGFWTVIPVFGLVRDEEVRHYRPIQERFRAEIRLFRKYGSLEVYFEPYLRELRRRGAETKGEIDRIEDALKSGKKMKYKEIIRDLSILEQTLEHTMERSSWKK